MLGPPQPSARGALPGKDSLMPTHRPSIAGSLAVALLGGALLLGGLFAVRAEVIPFVSPSGESLTRIEDLADGHVETGLSLLAQQMTLNDCRTAATSVAGLAQPTAVRRAMLATCQRAADEIAAASPTFSLAWTTGALVAAEAGDMDGFNSRLLRARLTAPYEHWLAEIRIGLAEDHYTDLDATNRAGHDDDIRAMLATTSGIDTMAMRYVLREDFRDRIIGIVETMPRNELLMEQVKPRFTRKVEQFTEELG
jgi:hypothetical protein